MKDHAPENHAAASSTKRRPPRVCTWCGSEFTDGRGDYCSDEHRRLARTIQAGSIPQRPCPRCGRNDLRVASAEFAICQTCGFQPTRPELLIVELTPPASVGMKRVKREILDEHGGAVFFANRTVSAITAAPDTGSYYRDRYVAAESWPMVGEKYVCPAHGLAMIRCDWPSTRRNHIVVYYCPDLDDGERCVASVSPHLGIVRAVDDPRGEVTPVDLLKLNAARQRSK